MQPRPSSAPAWPLLFVLLGWVLGERWCAGRSEPAPHVPMCRPDLSRFVPGTIGGSVLGALDPTGSSNWTLVGWADEVGTYEVGTDEAATHEAGTLLAVNHEAGTLEIGTPDAGVAENGAAEVPAGGGRLERSPRIPGPRFWRRAPGLGRVRAARVADRIWTTGIGLQAEPGPEGESLRATIRDVLQSIDGIGPITADRVSEWLHGPVQVVHSEPRGP